MAAMQKRRPGIGDAGRIAYRCRPGEHPPSACAGDLEPLSFAAIRHRRLSGALVRRLSGAEPSTVFGLYLNIFATPDFWPVVVLQAALTVWVLALLLRASASAAGRCCSGRHGGIVGRHHPAVAHQHSVDRHLRRPCRLGGASSCLRRRRTAALGAQRLVALIAFAAAAHSATFAVIVALLVAAALAWWYCGSAGFGHCARRRRALRSAR